VTAKSASVIAAALGQACREGSSWRCRCPLHGGRSLVIRDGASGRLLVTCWGGCERLDVLAELRRLGLLDQCADYAPRIILAIHDRDDASRIMRGLGIWRTASNVERTIVSDYLVSRGILLDRWPASLRYQPRCPRPRNKAGEIVSPLPAMLGLVEHVEHGRVAVHCTYLRQNGSGKADVEKPKAIFGASRGGSVRLGTPCRGGWLAVAEGIETALSIAVASSMPAWAALSASGLKNLILPPDATHVMICADHDFSHTGERAAYAAAARLISEGRRVRVAIPPEPGTDFNDLLTQSSVKKINEARHVAI
jgi:putative DNA primase/helicase